MCKFWLLLTIAVLSCISGSVSAGNPATTVGEPGELGNDARHELLPASPSGKHARALQFDGRSAYVDLGHALDFTKKSAFSVSFWMNSTDNTSRDQQMIVGKDVGFAGHSAPGWAIFIADVGYVYFQLNAAFAFKVSELQAWDLNTQICDGQWHHVVVTYNGNQDLSGVAFYIDGKAETLGSDSNNLGGGDIRNKVDATMGATAAPGGLYRGALHELHVFDRAITSADVAKLYAHGAGNYGAVGVGGLIAGYHLNEGRGTKVADFSRHGNDGTLHGNVTWVAGKVAAAETPTPAAGLSKGLQLDGHSGYIDIPAHTVPGSGKASLDMGGKDLTLAVWVKPSKSYSTEEILVEHGIWLISPGMYQLTTNDSKTVRFNFPSMNAKEGGLDGTVNLTDGNWHFLVGTFISPIGESKGVARIYDNGVLLKGKEVSQAIAADDKPADTYVGSRGGSSLFFNGSIGELLICDRAITSSEVARLYARGAGRREAKELKGLVGGYHFDEGRGTAVADSSGDGNDGTLHGNVTWVAGKVVAPQTPAPTAGLSKALEFDGTGYATLPTSVEFTSGDFTLSLWFNPKEADPSQFLFMRGCAYADQQGDIGLCIERSSGQLAFRARTADGQWLFGWGEPTFTAKYVLHQWNHVVVTRHGNTYTMWTNGAKAGSRVSTADISDGNNSNPFVIGGMQNHSGGRDCLFQGALKELNLFQRALSDSEVAALYNHGKGLYGSVARAPTNNGLVAGYHLDDVSHGVLADFSGHGHPGTLHNEVGSRAEPGVGKPRQTPEDFLDLGAEK